MEIGGNTTKLSTAPSKVNKEIRDTQSQLKDGFHPADALRSTGDIRRNAEGAVEGKFHDEKVLGADNR